MNMEYPNHAFLLSFPRSGNHWVRYILEWFSGRETLGESGGKDPPLHTHWPDFKVDINLPHIVTKRHHMRGNENKQSGMILILRDYHESIVRHGGKCSTNFNFYGHMRMKRGLHPVSYIQSLKDFDEWPEERRYLIYYEDLIIDVKKEIIKLLEFMHVTYTTEYLEDFMDKLDFHKDRCINFYSKNVGTSATKGKSIKYHIKQLGEKQGREWDEFVCTKFPSLASKYLSRYKLNHD